MPEPVPLPGKSATGTGSPSAQATGSARNHDLSFVGTVKMSRYRDGPRFGGTHLPKTGRAGGLGNLTFRFCRQAPLAYDANTAPRQRCSAGRSSFTPPSFAVAITSNA